jgi:HEAT repeat protein
LDLWAQQGTEAPLDPLVVALEDEDDDVRTRAMEIIEQHWSIEQHAEIETQH